MANNLEDELVARFMSQMMGTMADMCGIEIQEDEKAAPFAIPLAALPPEPKFWNDLCETCAGMTTHALKTDYGYSHVQDMKTLQESAQHCGLCDLIQMRIRRSAIITAKNESAGADLLTAIESTAADVKGKINDGVLVQPWNVFLKYGNSGVAAYDLVSIKGHLPVLSPVGNDHYRMDTIVMNFGHLCLHSQAPEKAAPILPRGTDEELLQRISTWLQLSTSDSALTQASPETSLLPTRVLDLGTELSAPLADLRLVETAGMQGQYITLSYCWGSYIGCRTLQNNLQARKDKITFSELPKGFKDAVIVTRALGVRYLWIDALCIIQDDNDDWTREASRMAEVYWNCHCRLAITDARAPTEGFFPPKRLMSSVLVPNLEQTELGSEESFPCYLTHPRHYLTDIDGGHLNTRMWVLQERLLSKRTIHFTHDHVYCEDQDDVCGEDWIRRHFTWRSCIEKSSPSVRSNLFPEETMTPEWSHEGEGNRWMERRHVARGNYRHMTGAKDPWLSIAERYSRCKVSYNKDKFIALAGLIKRKQCNSGTEYHDSRNFLGLWEKTLQVDLCWARRGSQDLQYLDELNLPTWSWLSHEGAICFTQDRRNTRDSTTVRGQPISDFQLLDIRMPELTEQLPLTTSASMTVRLKVRAVIRISREIVPPGEESHKTREELRSHCPFSLDPRTHTVPQFLSSLSESKNIFDAAGTHIGFVSFDQRDPSADGTLYCANIATLRDHWIDPPSDLNPLTQFSSDILSYALLLRATDLQENEYKRVGIAQLNQGWMSDGEEKTIKLV